MDELIEKIAGVGVAGLILITVMNTTGYVGAAAITAGLAGLGPAGMVGGVITFGVIAVISEAITKFGVDAVFTGVVKELYRKGESKESIKEKINKYPITKGLKNKLFESLERASKEL